MKKLLAAILMLTAFASPVCAARKHPKQAHPKFNYRYHKPKYKANTHKQKQHAHKASS